jgi:hypothetical protein
LAVSELTSAVLILQQFNSTVKHDKDTKKVFDTTGQAATHSAEQMKETRGTNSLVGCFALVNLSRLAPLSSENNWPLG